MSRWEILTSVVRHLRPCKISPPSTASRSANVVAVLWVVLLWVVFGAAVASVPNFAQTLITPADAAKQSSAHSKSPRRAEDLNVKSVSYNLQTPKQAQISLEERFLLTNTVRTMMPKVFVRLPESKVKTLYPQPQGRPTEMYATPDDKVNFTLSWSKDTITNLLIPSLKELYEERLWKQFPTMTLVHSSMVEDSTGKMFGRMEMLLPTSKTKRTYSLLSYTEHQGRLLTFGFNCSESDIQRWKLVGVEVVGNLRPVASPQQPSTPEQRSQGQ